MKVSGFRLQHFIVEAIADAADGDDELVADLLADMAEVDVYDAGFAEVFAAPDLFEQLLAGEDAAAIFGEGAQEVEFEGGEVYGDIVHGDEARARVDADVAEGEGGRLEASAAARLDAAEGGFDAGSEFARGEGFGDVVICADGEADDLVGLFGARSEEDDVDVGFAAEVGEEFDAVHAWEHDVEDDEVGLEGAGRFEPRCAIGGGEDLVAFGLEVGLDEFDDAGFVVYDEDFGFGHRIRIAARGKDGKKEL